MPEKILYLLRHAEAETAHPHREDHKRRLNERGVAQTTALAQYMCAQGVSAQHTLCSTATRARQTFDVLKENGVVSGETEHTGKLYHASANGTLRLIQHIPDQVKQLLVIGHNPGMYQLAAQLAEEGDSQLLDEVSLHYPPCTLSVFSLPIERWQEATLHRGILKAFLTPFYIERMQLSGVA